METSEKTAVLRKWIEDSGRIVFFGGAGVSTESGIPDFRSADGIYSRKYKYPPEHMLSREFFYSHTAEFYEFYRGVILMPDVKPNRAHLALTELERRGKLSAIVTQNIDGLHGAAGSGEDKVYELHGSVYRNFCLGCGAGYGIDIICACEEKSVPVCGLCGKTIKPDVVLYGETLDRAVMQNAKRAISEADLLIVGGTSLTVNPAAALVDYFYGDKFAIINKSSTPYDRYAGLVIDASVGETLSACL